MPSDYLSNHLDSHLDVSCHLELIVLPLASYPDCFRTYTVSTQRSITARALHTTNNSIYSHLLAHRAMAVPRNGAWRSTGSTHRESLWVSLPSRSNTSPVACATPPPAVQCLHPWTHTHLRFAYVTTKACEPTRALIFAFKVFLQAPQLHGSSAS